MSDLETVYRETSYIVEDNGVKLTIRLGRPNKDLHDLLRDRTVRTWAFLTAHNPLSQPLSDEENELRQSELIAVLDQQKYTYFAGYGLGDDPEWEAEPSLFILDIDRNAAIEIGKEFDQNAILWGRIDREPELIWCV